MRKLLLPLAMLTVLAFGANTAQAQVDFGAQVSLGDEVDFGIGARAYMPLDDYLENLSGYASFEIFFPGENQSFWMLNANGIYPIPMGDSSSGSIEPYAGAGIGVAHWSIDTGFAAYDYDETKVNLNILAGTTFNQSGSFTPFVELRLPLGGFDGIGYFLTGGIYF